MLRSSKTPLPTHLRIPASGDAFECCLYEADIVFIGFHALGLDCGTAKALLDCGDIMFIG